MWNIHETGDPSPPKHWSVPPGELVGTNPLGQATQESHVNHMHVVDSSIVFPLWGSSGLDQTSALSKSLTKCGKTKKNEKIETKKAREVWQ